MAFQIPFKGKIKIKTRFLKLPRLFLRKINILKIELIKKKEINEQYNSMLKYIKNNKKSIILYTPFVKGLGHISRVAKLSNIIVDKLGDKYQIVILTDSNIIPRINKKIKIIKLLTTNKYLEIINNDKLDREHERTLYDIRAKAISKIVSKIKPSIFFSDYRPKGHNNELVRTILKNYKKTKFILIMRDIFQNKEQTLLKWNNSNFVQFINKYYHKILIFGDQNMFDFAKEYDLKLIKSKMEYVGYLTKNNAVYSWQKNKNIIITVGSGDNREKIIDNICENINLDNIIVISGPSAEKSKIEKLQQKYLNVKFVEYVDDIYSLYNKARLIISLGGYNSMTELMKTNIPVIIIPEITLNEEEQLIRAKLFSDNNIFALLYPDEIKNCCFEKLISLSEKISKSRIKNVSQYNLSGAKNFTELVKNLLP
ncbi:hypothetical protein JXM83_04055 [Candidatus Woesearchaeota archaeon]|nr:hypothetical protein [Candidatus Woesearchaeota archaeon]